MDSHLGERLDEFSFISYLADRIKAKSINVVSGIGDDTAVIDLGLEDYLLFTCDCQIGNIHYMPGKISPFDVGRKLVAVNVSDICAMGGIPRWALIGLNIPKGTDFSFLKEFYDGLLAELEKFDVTLIGGNCSGTVKDTVFDMFLVGLVPKDQLVLRKGSQPGDALVVTGYLGLSRALLELLLKSEQLPENMVKQEADELVERFFVPKIRVSTGRVLAENGIARAMIDISDGLLQDTFHLCENSKVDVEIDIEKIPVHPVCEQIAKSMGCDPLEWALTGGEDYELLFSVSPDKVAILKDKARECNITYTVIGRFRSGEGRVYLKKGNSTQLIADREKIGWMHF